MKSRSLTLALVASVPLAACDTQPEEAAPVPEERVPLGEIDADIADDLSEDGIEPSAPPIMESGGNAPDQSTPPKGSKLQKADPDY